MGHLFKGQGAIEQPSAASACPLVGQGATEYLVLLAVVLIVALVSVALLGFFPSMASDAQMTQSKMYWSGASPIAIKEWDVKYYSSSLSTPYLRVVNTGAYPIRITKLLGAGGQWINGTCATGTFYDLYYLAPGEEKYFAYAGKYPGLPDRDVDFWLSGSSSGCSFKASSSICTAAGVGTLVVNDFGFEYIEYIEGQPITKRQVGKPLIIKCSG
jgi:hypothetical protein